jgi:hypothetical protein
MKAHTKVEVRVQLHVPTVSRKIIPGIHWIGEWLVYIAEFVVVIGRKDSTIPGIKPVFQPVASHFIELSRVLQKVVTM